MAHKNPHLIHPKYRPDIDGLRAVAILFVVGFHFFPENIQAGFIGVDIFFVISGFLISSIIFSSLERERFSFLEFYIRRIRRIFPALIFVMLACFMIGWFVLLSYDFRALGKHISAGAGFVSNFVLWKESGYFDTVAESKPLLHLWSLAVEEQFYIFWPTFMFFVWKRRWNFLLVTVVVGVVSFITNIYLITVNQTAAFYLPTSRFWELMMGGLLAYIVLHKSKLNNSHENIQAFIGFSCLIAALLLLDKSSAFPGYGALLPVIGSFFIISAGSGAYLNSFFLTNKVMVWIGLISYPLYLWHWPILSYLRITKGEPSFQLKLFAIVLSIFLAWLTVKYVEYPFRFSRGKRTKTVTLLVLMLGLGALGFYTFKSYGFEERVANGGLKIRPYDFKSAYRLNQCFLDGVTPSKFDRDCIGVKVSKKPTVFLWGDSHAASMYQGFLAEATLRKFNLAQFTTGGCPPVVDFDVSNRKQCKDLNAYVLSQIERYKPDTVILAAYWALYDGNHDEGGKKWDMLENDKIVRTIQILKSYGIKNITIMGHLPVYKMTQIKAGIRDFTAKGLNRTYNAFDFNAIKEDERIASIAKEVNVNFVSPIHVLCSEKGCMTSISKENYIPLAWDYGHLNDEGSVYFIQAAIKNGGLSLP